MIAGLIKWATKRRPCDLVVDVDYMERWYVIPRNRFFNIYIHHFMGSDEPIPHNHPWYSLSWIVSGHYTEHLLSGSRIKRAGSWTLRTPDLYHWIEIDKPVYTLFITGPRLQEWGFLRGAKWVHFMDHEGRR